MKAKLNELIEHPITEEEFLKWKAAWDGVSPVPEQIGKYVLAEWNKEMDKTEAHWKPILGDLI